MDGGRRDDGKEEGGLNGWRMDGGWRENRGWREEEGGQEGNAKASLVPWTDKGTVVQDTP